jgi:hypothetical protein
MRSSIHSLHSGTLSAPAHRAAAASQIAAISQARRLQAPMPAPASNTVQIQLTAVSVSSSFDAYIDINFRGSTTCMSLLVDSGNSTLIVPRYEDLAALPNFAADYQVLGAAAEPWGCPANIVRGPIEIPTTSGTPHVLQDCVFYACTADNPNAADPSEARTANFGCACLSPWSASGWNTPAGVGVTMQAPLSYNAAFPFAEFDYDTPENIFATTGGLNVSATSSLLLCCAKPTGYTNFNITPDLAWMAVTPQSLTIGNTLTTWPGAVVPAPIAMIDTGGGPVFLSDPNGAVYDKSWPDPTLNPSWTSSSTNCESTYDGLTIELTDGAQSYSYAIPALLPGYGQEWTLVMCEKNAYMMGQNGMNIGGISALVNSILIDYQNAQVGLKPRAAAPAPAPPSAPSA